MDNVCPAVAQRTRLLHVATAVGVVMQYGYAVIVSLGLLAAFLFLPLILLLACLEALPFPSQEEFLHLFCLQMFAFDVFMRHMEWLARLRARGAV